MNAKRNWKLTDVLHRKLIHAVVREFPKRKQEKSKTKAYFRLLQISFNKLVSRQEYER
jgi:hypothetical protein